MILNAEEELNLSLCLISALCKEYEVKCLAASLKQPQGAISVAEQCWISPAWTCQEPPVLRLQAVLAPALEGDRGSRLCFVPAGAFHGWTSLRMGTVWHWLGTVKFLVQAVAQGIEEQNLSVQSCP